MNILFWLSLFFLISACASDPKQPSHVLTRVAHIQKTLDQFSKAYKDHDPEEILSRLNPDSTLLEGVRDGIREDLQSISTARLVFVIDRVEMEDTSFRTLLRWQGAWENPGSSESIERKGEVIFSWINPDDPMLTEVRGDSPFGIFARRP